MKSLIQDPTDFGGALRECRKSLHLTQQEAARLAAVTQRLWSECETGRRTQVGLDTAIRMLQTVGADLIVETRKSRLQSSASR